ncbi:MAG: glutathione S-transferase family protein [Gammaproteobacteria bacterium]|nr:glutathione S-transferase family protein [Gammaproteobacteria bacterium]
MSTLTLHGFPISTYVRTCRMAADEKGVGYELEANPPQTPEQLAQHPWGKVPAMTHGDVRLYEATAITDYIDNAFDGPTLQPVDAATRAKMHQYISVINCYLYPPSIVSIVIQRLVVPQHGGTADEEMIKAAIPKAEKALDVINDALDGSDYLVGESLTLADLFLLPITHYLSATTPEGQDLMSKAGNINRWQDAMLSRASAKIALA